MQTKQDLKVCKIAEREFIPLKVSIFLERWDNKYDLAKFRIMSQKNEVRSCIFIIFMLAYSRFLKQQKNIRKSFLS